MLSNRGEGINLLNIAYIFFLFFILKVGIGENMYLIFHVCLFFEDSLPSQRTEFNNIIENGKSTCTDNIILSVSMHLRQSRETHKHLYCIVAIENILLGMRVI